MKVRCLILVLAMAMAVSPFTAMALVNGPETIDLKEKFKVEGNKKAVIFPHRKHQATLTCASCHQDPNGGGTLIVDIVDMTGSGNDFHQKLCWPCHIEMKVPRGKSCSNCHNKK